MLPRCVRSTFSVLIGFAVCANCPGGLAKGNAGNSRPRGRRSCGRARRHEEISNPPLSVHSRSLYRLMQHVRTASMQPRRPSNSHSWGFPRRMPAFTPQIRLGPLASGQRGRHAGDRQGRLRGGRPRTGRPRRKRSWSLSATSASSSRPKRQAVAVQQAVAAQRQPPCDDVTKHRQPRAPEPPSSPACPARSPRPAPAT